MPLTLDDVRSFMEITDDELDAEQASLFGGKSASEITPNVLEVVRILQSEPILSEPCVNWLKQKQSEMAAAKLLTLYTPEQIEELKARYGVKQ